MAATIVVSMWVWLQNACGQLGLQGKQLPGGGLLQNTTPYFFVFGCLILPPKPLVVKGLGGGRVYHAKQRHFTNPYLLKPNICGLLAVSQFGMRQVVGVHPSVSF